jgi:signal transduction histidine kinase/DNA-binding response OmpR family regulator
MENCDPPARLLVVEDSATEARMLQVTLEAAGFTVAVAADAEQALAHLRSGPFDLVLTDIVMPGLSGYELCRAIKADPSTRRIPVILLTTLHDPSEVIQGLEHGADNYMMKPYEPDDLVRRIRTFLSRTVQDATRAAADDRARIRDYFASALEDVAIAKERELASQRAEAALRASEKFLQSTLDALAAHIAILDEAGSIVVVNEPWHRFAADNGATTDGVGANYLDVCDAASGEGASDARAAAAGIRAVIAKRQDAFEMEYACHSALAPRWFNLRVTRFPGDGPTRVVVAHENITARKQAEATEREEAQTAAALARVGQEMVATLSMPTVLDRLCELTTQLLECDVSYTFLWDPRRALYSATAEYGATAEEWEAIRILEITPAMAGVWLVRPERVDAAAPALFQETTGPRAPIGAGRTLYMALRRGGELQGFQVAHRRARREFTAQQERTARGMAQIASLALENARLFDELDRANRVRSDFMNTMSHELRTPLHVVLGYTELLLEGTFGRLTAEQYDTVRRIAQNARTLSELVQATLDLSRIERGRLPLHPSETDLAPLIEEIQSETSPLCTNGQVKFVWQIAPRLPTLFTDRLKLKVVLKNLIGNALKFTEQGSVSVAVRPHRGGVEFTVTDTGIGIPPEALPIIFECFRQADNSMTREHGGVGLGLYIVRRLLDMLGGTVEVQSETGRGSTFRVWIPGDIGGRESSQEQASEWRLDDERARTAQVA